MLYLSVNVFSTKVLIGDNIIMSPTGDRSRHFTRSSKPRKGLATCISKAVPSFLSYFKTLSNGPSRESNPRPPALQSSALQTELILLRFCLAKKA